MGKHFLEEQLLIESNIFDVKGKFVQLPHAKDATYERT